MLNHSPVSTFAQLSNRARFLTTCATIVIFTAVASTPLSYGEPFKISAQKPQLKTLSQLKDKLAAGERNEFPAGTVVGKESHFLVSPQPMNWQDAEQFAEEHGAHLAVLPRAEYRSWLLKQCNIKRSLWLGGGLGSESEWQWIDGASWAPEDKLLASSNLHNRVALSAACKLFPASDSQRYHFILQWRNDGSNPATLDSQLERTVSTIASRGLASAEYPIGTRQFGDSRYFFIRSETSWNDARKKAISLGAHLAVPSSDAEYSWLRGTFGNLLAKDEALWLGGFRLKPADRWQWLTKEAWNNLGWDVKTLQENPLADRLVLRKGSRSSQLSWVASPASLGHSVGMILEWGDVPPQIPVAPADWQRDIRSANQVIAKQVGAEVSAFQRKRQPLIKEYVRSMKQIARKSGSSLGFRDIERSLDEAEQAGRMLEALPADASDELRSEHERSFGNLDILEQTYERTIVGHLNFYMQAVRKASQQLADTGYLSQALELNDRIKPIEAESFIDKLFSGTLRDDLPWTTRN